MNAIIFHTNMGSAEEVNAIAALLKWQYHTYEIVRDPAVLKLTQGKGHVVVRIYPNTPHSEDLHGYHELHKFFETKGLWLL